MEKTSIFLKTIFHVYSAIKRTTCFSKSINSQPSYGWVLVHWPDTLLFHVEYTIHIGVHNWL